MVEIQDVPSLLQASGFIAAVFDAAGVGIPFQELPDQLGIQHRSRDSQKTSEAHPTLSKFVLSAGRGYDSLDKERWRGELRDDLSGTPRLQGLGFRACRLRLGFRVLIQGLVV